MRRGAVLAAAVLIVAVAGIAGCAAVTERVNPFVRESSGTIRLFVENNNYHQATITALGNLRRRIGIVGGHASETFRVDWRSSDELQLEIDLLAGATYVSNAVPLAPGETATLYIQQTMSLSTLVRGGQGQ